MLHLAHRRTHPAFTIVELLIVIVVIAILAAITVVAYNGITRQAAEASLKSDVRNASTKLGVANAEGNSYPTPTLPTDITASEGNSFSYSSNGKDYCLTGTSSTAGVDSIYVSSVTGSFADGACGATGDDIQTVSSANCPTDRTRVVDARDNHSYWIQKLTDGQCWMLTNLAYAGSGTNTYGDTTSLTNGTGGSTTYTVPSYYVVPSTTNFTTEPTDPSTSTDGTGQYGYLYNWCGAMGGQATAACLNATTPAPNPDVTICPTGWRLPTASEFTSLNNAVNGGATDTDAGLRTGWLAQRSGSWYNGFNFQTSRGYFWASTPDPTYGDMAWLLRTLSTTINTAWGDVKSAGLAVRCVAL